MHTPHFFIIILCSVLIVAAVAQDQAEVAEPTKTVSTTIDFLDYCFYRTDPATGYFTEQQYEEVIRALAQAGFAKIYLRVDACGRTLYPSTAGTRYRGDGREPGSTFLLKTLKRYDPAAKTIELGHKYGLQVWCWYAFLDDEATMVHYGPGSNLGRRYGEYPLKDPFLVQNPHLQWRLDPRIEARQKAQAATTGRAGPVTALRIRSDLQHRTNRVRSEDVVIYTSNDNATYQRVEGSVTMTVEQEKPAVLVFGGLTVEAPYIQMVLRTPHPVDDSFTVAGAPARLVELYYDNAWHEAVADYTEEAGAPEQTSFGFRGGGRFAWDYDGYRIGIAKFPSPMPRHYGVIELTHPKARKHKLAKLRELACYGFDGFAFSIRTHSQTRDASAYGYGDAVRDAYLKRYGRDIWREPFDREQWLALRAEGLNQFMREAGRAVTPRPLFMDAPRPGSGYLEPYGGVPLQHERWIGDGSIAGLRMLGYGPDEVLRPLLGYPTRVKVVRFVDNSNVPAPDVFRTRLCRWLEEPGLDEIEFYETLIYTDQPQYLSALREALADRNLLPASAR
ncbi:MAG: hypothetical protein HY318_16975 [Armatimonadetes bacterium]|nr:hypothetical protein [Armatimonadota bacterium]